jgi:hypothetical protein
MAEQDKPDWRAALKEAYEREGSIQGVYDRFWPYSYTNQILFLMQGYHEPMASLKRWNQLGRKVTAGSRAGKVIVPLLVKEPAPELSEDEGVEALKEKRERVARLVGFKLVNGVFPLSATTGEELPHVEPPGWSLTQLLGKTGIREGTFDHTDGNIQGYSRGLEFAINPLAVNRNRTIFHEIGHIMLGHTIGSYPPDMHKGRMEGEAEMTAYLCMKETGTLDDETAAHSSGYLHHWMQGENLPEKSIIRIFRTVEAILRAGRVTPGDTLLPATE